jgi:hypothetical protein
VECFLHASKCLSSLSIVNPQSLVLRMFRSFLTSLRSGLLSCPTPFRVQSGLLSHPFIQLLTIFLFTTIISGSFSFNLRSIDVTLYLVPDAFENLSSTKKRRLLWRLNIRRAASWWLRYYRSFRVRSIRSRLSDDISTLREGIVLYTLHRLSEKETPTPSSTQGSAIRRC